MQDKAILIAEDEPLIAMDLAQALERAGAVPAIAATLDQALTLANGENLSAAVIDHVLSDGESSPLCRRLDQRAVPFVIYSGVGKVDGACANGAQVSKPEKPEVIVAKVAQLLRGETKGAA